MREEVASHAHGDAVVDTCQRIEVYGQGECDCGADRHLEGLEALRHLGEVAAGLHSIVLGEVQVMGQVRTGLSEASEATRSLAAPAIAAARELRRNHGLRADAGGLLDLALTRTGLEPEGSFLVLGTGHQARLTARRAAELGYRHIIVAGRRPPPADWLGAHRHQFVSLLAVMEAETPDVLVGCLASDAGEMRPGVDVPVPDHLVLDLGTPRNFAPVESVPQLAIADLAPDTAGAGCSRRHLRSELADLINRRLSMAREDSASPVGALRSSVEQSRRLQLEKLSRLHPDVSPAKLDAITRTLVNHLFHAPSERLRTMDDPELGHQVASLFAPGAADSSYEGSHR